MINFKANFIKPVTIKHGNNKQDVSFVEIDTNNKKDITTLSNVAYGWGIKTYAYDIYTNAADTWRKGGMGFYSVNPEHYYAVTKQKDNFEDLNFNEILGVVQLNENDDSNEIKYLQIDPKHCHGSDKRKYSNIGHSIVDSLKSLYPQKKMTLYANYDAIDFYKKEGFKEDESNTRYYEMYYQA